MNTKTERTRALNDDLRQNFAGGLVVLTPGIRALELDLLSKIGEAVSTFKDFDQANDPYDEHDFGSVTVDSHVVFFKIDYFDLDLLNHSPDPSEPAVTRRVLTVMLAEEY